MPHTCALQEKCLILPYLSLSFGKDTAIITYLPTLTTLTVMYDIQLNESGSRHLEISDANLETIRKHNLFHGLFNSSGYVTEDDLEKLKLNIRSLIAACHENSKDLLDLCIDVIYHDKMKAYGLRNLVNLYGEWAANHPQENTEDRYTEAQD